MSIGIWGQSSTTLHEQVGFLGLVCGLELPRWWPNFLEDQWELDFGVKELFGALPLAEFGWDGGSLDDLDARRPDPVTRSHLIVHMLNRTI